MKRYAFLLAFVFPLILFAEDGGNAIPTPSKWWDLIGYSHPMLVHFPIALVFMTALAEILYGFTKQPLYHQAAEFMIVAAAILVVPTILTGLVFASIGTFTGLMQTYLNWHMFFGITSAILAILTAVARERPNENKSLSIYYTLLTFLFLSVSITGFLGGEMTYGFPFSILF